MNATVNSEDIGARLRAARLKTKQSLRSVAGAVGVSPSLLSQVETGKTQPSVSTLYALVTQLGITFDELLGTGTRPAAQPGVPSFDPDPRLPRTIVQHGEDNPTLIMENGVTWERLAAPPGGVANCLLVTYDPGAASSVEGRLMRHYGFEHAYILEGELTLQIEFDEYTLGPGDSIYFESQQPHLYVNRSDQPVRGVWFLFGRRELQDTPASIEVSRAAPGEVRNAVDVLQAWDGLAHSHAD